MLRGASIYCWLSGTRTQIRADCRDHSRETGDATPTSAPRGAAPLPGQIDRAQAEIEARAKISWGDPPEQVTKYLIRQGFSQEEAAALVHEMFQERKATIRSKGIGKIVMGTFLVAVPIVAWSSFLGMGRMNVRLLAVAIIVGVWGAWTVLGGIFMLLAPKSEQGDVADE